VQMCECANVRMENGRVFVSTRNVINLRTLATKY
jgi:hypothetical protein